MRIHSPHPKFVLSFWATFIFLSLASCSDRTVKVPVSATYSSIQAVTLSQKCLQCHSSLSTYEGVLAIVVPGNPSSSELYRQINGGGMPQWSPSLSSEEIQAVYQWILEGAPND